MVLYTVVLYIGYCTIILHIRYVHTVCIETGFCTVRYTVVEVCVCVGGVCVCTN